MAHGRIVAEDFGCLELLKCDAGETSASPDTPWERTFDLADSDKVTVSGGASVGSAGRPANTHKARAKLDDAHLSVTAASFEIVE
jgi:hypothetical protein